MGTELTACVVCGGALRPAMDKDGFALVSCVSCGMLMRAELPAHEELREIYAPEYFTASTENPADGYADYLADVERHRETARRRLALIDRFARGRGRLLDVGAAAGFFVDEAIRAGWDAGGVDIASQMVEWGRRELDIPLRVGEVADVEGSGTFTAITMWDYVEHSLDPAGELAATEKLLAPGGIVALSTGDLDSLAARVSRSRWHLLTPRHHNFFFSARTLARLLEGARFEVLWVGHPGTRYSLAHLAYKAAPASLASRIASSRFARYSLPVNLFDIVTVVARKAAVDPTKSPDVQAD